MAKPKDEIEDTKRLMGALVRMKPKPHEEMKVGKSKFSKKKSPASGRAKEHRNAKEGG
jgi:hypothetical protein